MARKNTTIHNPYFDYSISRWGRVRTCQSAVRKTALSVVMLQLLEQKKTQSKID